MSPRSKRVSRRLFAVLILTVTGGLLSPSSARAAAAGLWSIGLDFGMALPSDSSQTLAWGLGVTRRFSPTFGIEANFLKYGSGINVQSDTVTLQADTSHTLFGIKPAYYIPGSSGLWQIGLKLGYSSNSVTATSTDTSGTTNNVNIDNSHSNIYFGPSVSYDAPFGNYTLGAELSYILGMGTSPPKGILFILAAKYWF